MVRRRWPNRSAKRQGKAVLRNRLKSNRSAVWRPIAGKPLTFEAGSDSCDWENGRDLQGRRSTRLIIVGGRGLERLVSTQSISFESVQIIVVKDGPPLAFREAILRCAFAPGLSYVPFRRHRR